jgi:hypothetical protein
MLQIFECFDFLEFLKTKNIKLNGVYLDNKTLFIRVYDKYNFNTTKIVNYALSYFKDVEFDEIKVKRIV